MLYLVRHAKTQPDESRPPASWELDPAGTELADRMGALPCFSTAYRLVSSSEPKAMGTAAIIRRHHSRLPETEPFDALRETYRPAAVPAAEHDAAIARLFERPDEPTVAGWETAADALSRFARCVETLVAEAAGRDLIVVSHATILSLYLAKVNGQERVSPGDWQAIRMPDYAAVDTATMRVVQPFGAWMVV